MIRLIEVETQYIRDLLIYARYIPKLHNVYISLLFEIPIYSNYYHNNKNITGVFPHTLFQTETSIGVHIKLHRLNSNCKLVLSLEQYLILQKIKTKV